MTRRRNVKPLAVSQNLLAFLEELQEETSDRHVAILAHGAVDDLLGELIRTRLRPDCKEVDILLGPEGALGSFSARMNYAYASGIVGSQIHADLKNLNDIRRVFAHSVFTRDNKGNVIRVNFKSPSLADKCKNFGNAKRRTVKGFARTPKEMFVEASTYLVGRFWFDLMGTKPAFKESYGLSDDLEELVEKVVRDSLEERHRVVSDEKSDDA
jgi:hypothetical protein